MRLNKMRTSSEKLSAEKRQAVEKMVLESAENNCLACATAEMIAKSLGVQKLTVGITADRLNIKVSRCQMGCF